MASVEARVLGGPGLLDVLCGGDDSIVDSDVLLISLPLAERFPLMVSGELLKLGSPLECEIAPWGGVALASRDFPLFLPYCFRVNGNDRRRKEKKSAASHVRNGNG